MNGRASLGLVETLTQVDDQARITQSFVLKSGKRFPCTMALRTSMTPIFSAFFCSCCVKELEWDSVLLVVLRVLLIGLLNAGMSALLAYSIVDELLVCEVVWSWWESVEKLKLCVGGRGLDGTCFLSLGRQGDVTFMLVSMYYRARWVNLKLISHIWDKCLVLGSGGRSANSTAFACARPPRGQAVTEPISSPFPSAHRDSDVTEDVRPLFNY
eukprot:3941064-Rhodomonas_salina.3